MNRRTHNRAAPVIQHNASKCCLIALLPGQRHNGGDQAKQDLCKPLL